LIGHPDGSGTMTDSARPGRCGGFLMVEVLIALAIAGLVFALGYQALSGGFDRLGKDRNSMRALVLAQSTLDRVGHDIALGASEITGNRDGFSWIVQTAPYTGDANATAGPMTGYLVRVTVQWQERNSAQQVQLTTLRLARRDRDS